MGVPRFEVHRCSEQSSRCTNCHLFVRNGSWWLHLLVCPQLQTPCSYCGDLLANVAIPTHGEVCMRKPGACVCPTPQTPSPHTISDPALRVKVAVESRDIQTFGCVLRHMWNLTKTVRDAGDAAVHAVLLKEGHGSPWGQRVGQVWFEYLHNFHYAPDNDDTETVSLDDYTGEVFVYDEQQALVDDSESDNVSIEV
jgi:hypothetical protein